MACSRPRELRGRLRSCDAVEFVIAARSDRYAQTGELLYLLVLKELRVRYKSSILGYFWALANPLAFTVVYYVAFQVILKTGVPNYALFLITGMFPWTWLMNALVQSTAAYRGNPSLVRKVRLPRAILPLSTTVQHMVHFVFAIPILLAAVVLSTGHSHLSWIVLVPVATAVELAIIYPLGVMLAAFNAAVRDVEYLVTIALQMLFFLTPVVYPVSAIPEAHRVYFDLNPATPIIEVWRRVLYDGVLDGPAAARCAVFALVAGAAAYFVHRAMAPRIGELL